MPGRDFVVPLCREEPEVLYCDRDLLLVCKPAGLLSVPGRDPRNRDSLISRLQSGFPDALTVHRLDMDTSGVMVIARDKAIHADLSRQFRERTVTKEYHAVVAGIVNADEGVVDLPLTADWPNRPLQKICHDRGKAALTRYRVSHRDRANNISTVVLHPETGRSHQLRVHLAALGHPILGDNFYADEHSRSRSPRLLLHATRLTLLHPRERRPLTAESKADLLSHLRPAG